MPDQNKKIISKYQGDKNPDKRYLKLGRKITDVVAHKIGGVTSDDPEYWGLREVLTPEMCDVANKMKLRKHYTFEQLLAMNKEYEAIDLQKLLDEMSYIGILEYDYGDNYDHNHELKDRPRIRRYRVPFYVPGSAELFNSSVDRIAKNPAVASFFERMTFIPLAGITQMVPPGGDGIGMHVIPVEKAIDAKSESVDLEHISYWLQKYEGHISAGICSCRASRAVLGDGCTDDFDDWCIQLGDMADYPCFRIKENAEIHMGRKYTKLNTEGYGGMICSTWMDRPLSVAGRVLIKENDAITSRLLTLDRDLLMIPSVAIHMNREVNDKASYNKQVDMLPLLGGAAEEGVLKKLVAAELQVAEEQILGSDLFLCIREKAAVWGCNEEFISSGRLDDQQCVFGILKGFLNAHCARSINVAAFFDNEEVGSGTKQGAASTFLYDVLHRIAQNVCPGDEDFHRAVASSFMFSADNAHAVHPNHPEYTDVNNCTYMNEGVVVKVHAGQKYTSDGMSMAVAKELAARAGVPLQYFANRSDKVGGSTLGNLAMAQVSMNCVDIGLPQLAMHSCYETAGARDIVSLIRLMEEFYASHFEETASGTLAICK